jgi:flagellar assembly factor FliW
MTTGAPAFDRPLPAKPAPVPRTPAKPAPAPRDEQEPVLHFVEPLLGLPNSRRYALRPLPEGYAPFASIVSLDEEDLRFVVVPPKLLFPDYEIEIPPEELAELGLGGGTEAEPAAGADLEAPRAPEVWPDFARALGATGTARLDPTDAIVLVIVSTNDVPTPVANLLAPIVVNPRSGAAAQVVLEESGYGLRVPVDAGSARRFTGSDASRVPRVPARPHS